MNLTELNEVDGSTQFHDPDDLKVEIEPEIYFGPEGELQLVMVLSEGRVFDKPGYLTFLEHGQSGIQEPVLYLHSPLSKLIECEREWQISEDSGLYPLRIKPKYDKIREELLRLVASIDKMVYEP